MSTPLSSWKEIASYLGKGVRTVQRWERQFGLPVRRPSAKSHVIFAVQQELDGWIKQHQKAPVQKPDLRGNVAIAKKRRQEQVDLLTRLNRTFGRLEANEQELDKTIKRLTAGFPRDEGTRLQANSKRTNGATAAGKFKHSAA